jgi:hypothetical protein
MQTAEAIVHHNIRCSEDGERSYAAARQFAAHERQRLLLTDLAPFDVDAFDAVYDHTRLASLTAITTTEIPHERQN